MTKHIWSPIKPLADEDKKIDLAAMRPLYQSWRTSEAHLKQSSENTLNDLNQRLIRRLSIETGTIQNLYEIDRGTTEALIAAGFVENIVARSSTDIEPSHLIDILHDHEDAIQFVMNCCIGDNKPLTKSVIHELHTILTRHQNTTTIIDGSGARHTIPLLKGQFKEHPFNPCGVDGELHEYCPPAKVDSEMDNLLKWLSEYDDEDPIIVAAWFNHRITQIHPYQSGNGRLARALTTLILLRASLLPLVIDRDLRVDYTTALDAADADNLLPLATLFARLERSAILQALSFDIDREISGQHNLSSASIARLADKFGKRRQAHDTELRKVNALALELQAMAHADLELTFNQLGVAIMTVADPIIRIVDGGPDRGNAHWYKHEVVATARESGKFANFSEDHYFVKASIRAKRERLVFVISFHHVGRELSGIMEATTFATLESFEDSDDRQSVSGNFFVCSPEPVVFTYMTRIEEIEPAFSNWLDSATSIAVNEFGDRLY